jgi:septal ring factor EnvC (AmiA/AmiB activator)
MARPATGTNFNIAQLERVLQEKKAELDKLRRQRLELQKKMDQLDRQIERVEGGMNGSRRASSGGAVGGGGRRRARNEHSLLDSIEMVLREAGRAMKVPEIMEAVLATGYRSSSDNFRGIVNQTLIKDKRFGQVERGVYELKSAGESKKKEKTKSAA